MSRSQKKNKKKIYQRKNLPTVTANVDVTPMNASSSIKSRYKCIRHTHKYTEIAHNHMDMDNMM